MVAAGLVFGRSGARRLTAAARVQQREIWDLIVFLLTGLSFLLVGLELRPIIEHLTTHTSRSLIVDGLIVVVLVVGVRMAWMFGATALPGGRHLFSANQGTPATWRETTVVGWAGMRGAISLAAALALPQSFADRDLVIFLTFAVIAATLVGQGLTLPPLIRRLGLISPGDEDLTRTAEIRRRLTVVALAHLDALGDEGGVPDAVVGRVRMAYEHQLDHLDRRLDGPAGDGGPDEPTVGPADSVADLAAERSLRRQVIAAERDELERLVRRRKVSGHVAGEVRAALDVDETSMRP